MTGLGKIQSITIIPIEPRQVAIQIGDGNMFYFFNYDDIFVNTDSLVVKASSSSAKASSSSAKASLGDNVPIIHFTELTMPTSTTDLTKLKDLSILSDCDQLIPEFVEYHKPELEHDIARVPTI